MNTATAKLGFYSALVAFIGAIGYSIVQILQVLGCFAHPADDILIYGFSLVIAIPFMLAMLSLHYLAPVEKKVWSHAAVLLSVMYAIYVTLMYTVQLVSVIPASQHGISNPVLAVAPQSFFWTIDALGYICMGLATLFAAPVFRNNGLQKWLKVFFIANGLLTPVIAIVYFYPHFSTALLLLGSPWIITAPGSILMLVLFFRKAMQE